MSVTMARCLPWQTSLYIVKHHLAGQFPSVKQMVIWKQVKFEQSLLNSPNGVINKLDNLTMVIVRTMTGLYVRNIRMELEEGPLFTNKNSFC